jgi:hypothetical protein
MLFKSDVPMAHRAAFVLAGMSLLAPLRLLATGAALNTLDFFPAALFWLLVIYQWRQRQTLKWQVRNAAGHGHNTPADLVQTGLDRLPDSAYWLLLMLSAFALVWAFTRG